MFHNFMSVIVDIKYRFTCFELNCYGHTELQRYYVTNFLKKIIFILDT